MLDIVNQAWIYMPLSVIGVWRWSVWGTRKIAARMYRPIKFTWPKSKKKPKVSIVTPVYNEDPKVFKQAVESWISGGADEIVAVIDKVNTRLIMDFQRYFVGRDDVKCKLVVTPKPGKRAALCDGISRSSGDLIALADSDTIWSKDLTKDVLPYFSKPEVGGVTLKQRIYKPSRLAHYLFDIQLWTRYSEEVPSLLAMGRVVNTLSGRTAIYKREALLNPKHDNLHHLRHEFYLGSRCVSGDDKRLTHLVIEQGWHLHYAAGPTVYTTGMDTMKEFLKQRLRWTRNSWRADTRAFGRRWVFKHPALAIHNFDRFIQPLFMLLGPVAFVLGMLAGNWTLVVTLLIWWTISRFIRLFGYFHQHPKRLIYLPAYIVFTYITAIQKIYAWATLIEHSWATRWHKSRMKRKNFVRRLVTVGRGAVVTSAAILSLVIFVEQLQRQAGLALDTNKSALKYPPPEKDAVLAAKTNNLSPADKGAIMPTDIKTYRTQPGDTIDSLAQRWGLTVRELKIMNHLKDPDEISIGQTVYYYDKSGGSSG